MRLPLILFLLTGLTATAGCHWGGAREIELEPFVPGLAELSYDGLNLHVKRDPAGALLLHVGGTQLDEADLRLGGQFVLTDGIKHDYYRVMLLDEERITLKLTSFVDRQQQREGYRRTERVIAVMPYTDETPGARLAPGAGASPRSE